MRTEYWVVIIVVAFLIGILIGYGIWGSKAAEVPALKAKVEELTKENEALKARVPAAPPAEGAPAAPPVAPPAKQ